MTGWTSHLVTVPVVLPLAAGALTLMLKEERYVLKGAISIASLLLLVCVAAALVRMAEAPAATVYSLGNWTAPFGIVLVADRLSAVLVLLAAILGLSALLFSLARWHRAGPRFHALLQFLLMGVNGAFLTGDLFNLFVFFELMLAASYALALHGSGIARVRASLHYIVINLAASLLFLIGVALIYSVTGTLNMADLSLRIQAVAAEDRLLVEAGISILAVAFLVKAAMWPLGFWLPSTYAAAAAPAAALFAILSKVGLYAVLRLWLLFTDGSGADLLLVGGMATLAFGLIGILAAPDISRLAGFSLIASSGTVLAALGFDSPDATAAALYYLVVSTLGVAAFFLLIELVQRTRAPGADVLMVTAEVFVDIDDHTEAEEEVGGSIPATMAVLGLSFACCALLLAGLPPLPGFIAKFALLTAVLEPDPIPASAWMLLILLTVSGLVLLIALGRTGVRIFWASQDRSVPRVRVIEMAPVALLLLLCVALTVAAGPAMRYFQQTAAALHAAPDDKNDVMRNP